MNSNTLIVILLAVIAYILWRIFRQKEDEKAAVAQEKFDAEWEQKKKDEFKGYPHLFGKIDFGYLKLFGEMYVEKGLPHLKAAWYIYAREANNTKQDVIEADQLWHGLWDVTEELLEHLEKYHESSKYEFEIAILNYWQVVSLQADSLIGMDAETIKKTFQSAPFTDILEIPSWFPKKSNHPDHELSFRGEGGLFPRESKGSALVQEKLKALGL